MLHRNSRPNKDKWNGLGGKIQNGETPEQTNLREVFEESDLDLRNAKLVRFVGIVTWDVLNEGSETFTGGMYVYIAELEDKNLIFAERETREGRLEWKDIDWVVNKDNYEVVDNIPHFLPLMLDDNVSLKEYRYTYKDGQILDKQVYPLTKQLLF